MNLTIPQLSLVLLIGASGSGKSTFARTHFRPTEVISSDTCRGLVADDENDQSATSAAFEILHAIAAQRLAGGRLTVIDATNVQAEARQPLIALARQYHCLLTAIVFNLPEALCHERNQGRPDRDFGPHVIRRQLQSLRRSLRGLQREGFHTVHVLDSPEVIANVTITRQRLWTDRRELAGPFDIIGDIHGCYDELMALLTQLGYKHSPGASDDGQVVPQVEPPPGRRAIFLGDLTDRGPASVAVLRLVMAMVAAGTALCVPGNHDTKLLDALRGRQVQRIHGLDSTLDQLASEPTAFKTRLIAFLESLVSHNVLDGGQLVVAHAGLKEVMHGRASRAVRNFALYGDTTGETDEFGLPVRLNWAADYRGRAMVVYGHSPVAEPDWLNNTINIDTGCVFGGRLTALRYPERELVSIPAATVYARPGRPFLAEDGASPTAARPDDLLDIDDVNGKRLITTRLHPKIMIQAEQAAAALEVMSRFAIDPRWLIYLPPTMSPCETTPDGDWLEYPEQAFEYFRRHEVVRVISEEKHMGSRAVVVVTRDAAVAQRRFAGDGSLRGIIYTRTGRRFFNDRAIEQALVGRLIEAMTATAFWERFSTDWACFDCELMPWSAKAQELIRHQYAAVATAGQVGLSATLTALTLAATRGLAVDPLLQQVRERGHLLSAFRDAYRRYCWPVTGLADLQLAPFHLLATEGAAHVDKTHQWHLATVAELCQADQAAYAGASVLLATQHRVIELNDPASCAAGATWWEEITASGSEGMVVKPERFITHHGSNLVQPAVKVRGRDYLRIIYGPEYTRPEHLARLRKRGLGRKRALAQREFALGVEALERHVAGAPLYRVHECIFAVLALESEPVDPRL